MGGGGSRTNPARMFFSLWVSLYGRVSLLNTLYEPYVHETNFVSLLNKWIITTNLKLELNILTLRDYRRAFVRNYCYTNPPVFLTSNKMFLLRY